jgi:hypothetical protein
MLHSRAGRHPRNLAFLRRRGPFLGPGWFRLPKPALVDVASLCVLIVPFVWRSARSGISSGPLPDCSEPEAAPRGVVR